MDTIQKTVLIGHTLIAVLIIIFVLLQRGKGADAGAAFGAGSSGTVFGSRGSASFFSRATAVLATAFFASSLTLAYLSSQGSAGPTSLLDDATPVENTVEAGPVDSDEQPAGVAGADELPSLDEAAPAAEDLDVDDELPAVPEND